MRVLIGCEFSGVVREAFRRRGHNAWSCDLLAAEDASRYHYQGDVLEIVDNGWDLAIFHPPCTHLSVSGARWATDHWVKKKSLSEGKYWHDGSRKRFEQGVAIAFAKALLDAPIDKIALENPVSILSTAIRKPDQIIQPWQYGHGELKATCLWLKNLPKLVPTNIVKGRKQAVWLAPPSDHRWKDRSRTYEGIAEAMAEQWGSL